MGGKSTKTLDIKFKNMIYQNQIPYNPHQVLLGKQKKKITKRERHTYCNNLKYITIFLPCLGQKRKRKAWNTKIKYIIILSRKKSTNMINITLPSGCQMKVIDKISQRNLKWVFVLELRIGWNWKIHTTIQL